MIPDKDPHKQQLMKGFKLEWDRWKSALQKKKIVSIYFGGGTPALIGAPAISEILSWIRESVEFFGSPEITLEANPENITSELMRDYCQAGINRVSIGIQTLDDKLLTLLQRLHSAKKAVDAVYLTAAAGISNISVDLMYDLPGQTLQSWQHTLNEVQKLPITHLSLYNLTIEPHTVFFKYRKILSAQQPDPDVSLAMYQTTVDCLGEYNLQQYEISAFAKPDFYSRHNVGYWVARPFLGLGPSAFSYWDKKRFRNVANLSRYCKALEAGESPIDFEEELDPQAQLRELLTINLRVLAGVDLAIFQARNGILDDDTLATLSFLTKKGLLESIGQNVKLSAQGILLYDTIASELI